jgi:L-lactate dehydrogenase complex protein LldG
MLVETFLRQAEAVGAECRVVASREDGIRVVAEVLEQAGAQAVWADDGFLSEEERRELAARISGLHFEVTRERAAAAQVGVTAIEWGVAQTGSLVSDSSAVAKRLASTLPALHVALLPTSRIVADLPAALARLDVRRTPFVAAITGPSRTADIERVLTIGVHGPKRLLIVLIGGAREEAAA